MRVKSCGCAQTLNEILADATGQPVEQIARDVDRDYILEPRAALEYGMIDHMIASRQPSARTDALGRITSQFQ